MATKELDFSKILFTGVKRNKSNLNQTSSDGTHLRMRILPEADGQPAKKLKKQQIEEIENSDENAVQLFSSSKPTKLEPTTKKVQKNLEADAKKEKVTKIRKLNQIFTWGDEIADPFINFPDLKLSPVFLHNLSEFQIKEPSPIQMQAIPLMLQRRDILAAAPTGSGKTLAFILPVIKQLLDKPEKKLSTIILEPTRVLARQVFVQFVKYCQNLPIKYAFYTEGEFPADSQVIITTPNRLISAVETDNALIKKMKTLEWIIMDESDKLFDDHESTANFREKLGKIFKWCDGAMTRKAFFSATFSHEVEHWCKEHLVNVAMICIGERNTSNSLVSQQLIYAGSESGKISAIRDVLQKGFDPPAIIFVQNKDRAGQLYSQLRSDFPKLPIELISSEITDKEKDKILDQVRCKKCFVLICTELIGRGIDLPSVNLVINFDLPTSIVSYIHRVGRTGRAGHLGRAITYFTETDLKYIRPIATVIHQAGFDVPSYTLALDKPTKKLKKELQSNEIERKTFGSVKKWEKIKRFKRMNEEIMEVIKVKGQMLADDDTGGDIVGRRRRQKPIGKKKLLEKKNETKAAEIKPVIKKKNVPKKMKSIKV
uniref:Probable ATP-dependent RNA helicase DDX52 n=1 Tax=Panagrolaimus davidi TaxID=227884 RepID=A0A914QLT6_9BILA